MVPLSLCLVREFLIHLIPYTFPGILAPFDTRSDVIPDYKPAGTAAHLDIVREDLYFFPALRALLYRKRRGPEIRGTRTMVKHQGSPVFLVC